MNVFILYKTVRIETGEYYIGVHGIDTDRYPRFNDPYLGSGIRIEASVKKHGKKSFKRSILSISESRDVILALEKEMVTVEMIADPLCLNLAPGGRAGVKGVPGPKHSVETRQAMSDARKGVPKGPRSPGHCQAISDAQKGVPKGPFSVEHCQAISDAMKGVPKSHEHRQAISDAQKGVPKGPFSVEHCQAMGDVRKGVPKSPEHCQAMSDVRKGVPKSPEHRQAISDGQRGVPKSPEHRQAMSDAKKEYWRQRKQSDASMNN